MRRNLFWVAVPLLLAVSAAPVSRAYAGKGDDDLLNQMGSSPAKKSTAPNPPPPPPPPPPPQGSQGGSPAHSAPASPSPAPAPSPSASSNAEASPADPNGGGVVDRVKAVPRRDLLKRRRLELSPHTGVSLNDPYFVHLEFGGSLIFYPHDNFGIGVGADWFYVHPRTTNVDAVRLGLTSVLATFDLPVLMAHLDFYWLPIYGKVSVFNSWIVNFDVYASAGLGVATAFGSHTPLEANVAVGSHYALTQWLALKAEVREHMFVDTQVANNIPRSSVQSYTMFLLGVSFFVPPTFEYSFQ